MNECHTPDSKMADNQDNSGPCYPQFSAFTDCDYGKLLEVFARRSRNISHVPSWRDRYRVRRSRAFSPISAFRLTDLPFEIRRKIFFLAIGSSDNIWLDREAIHLGESLRHIVYYHGHIVWRGSNHSLLALLLVNKQVHDEVDQMLYNRFAFHSGSWGYIMKYSDPSKTPNRLPKHRIKHITYTPYLAYMREHRVAANRILSGLPLLSSVRILVSWQCLRTFLNIQNEYNSCATRHIVTVARLFQEVGRVAVIGQSLSNSSETKILEEARQALKDEPWYWELGFDYPIFVQFAEHIEEHL